jgi:hypothetical protein
VKAFENLQEGLDGLGVHHKPCLLPGRSVDERAMKTLRPAENANLDEKEQRQVISCPLAAAGYLLNQEAAGRTATEAGT